MMKLSALALGGAAMLLIGSAQDFDPKPWLEDLNQSRAAFIEKYANFDRAIFQREINLAKLFDETRDRLTAAHTEQEAKAAFDRLARQLGDGHVEFQWPSAPTIGAKSTAPINACADLGYDVRKSGRPLASHIQGCRADDLFGMANTCRSS